MQAFSPPTPALPDAAARSSSVIKNAGLIVTSIDIVAAYEQNPEISRAIAQRLSDLLHAGERCTTAQLAEIIIEEREKSPILTWRRQRAHPLYYTHHHAELIRNWTGDGPAVPEKAIIHYTPWIAHHADADEDDVRELAKDIASTKKSLINSRLLSILGSRADKFLRSKDPTELTEKNLRRTFRAAFRQFNETAAHILGKVGKNKEKYVSKITRKNRRNQLESQNVWIAATVVKADGQPTLRLSDCIRTAKQRHSETYTLVRGQELYYTSIGYVSLFVTLTTPAEYHPQPAHGHSKWDGSSVLDSHAWLNRRWQRTRAALWKKNRIKLDGLRVTEPHKDGAEHWHLLIYAPPGQIETIKEAILSQFAHSEHAVVFKSDFAESDKNQDDGEDGKKKKKASAASYLMKYLVKTIPSGKAPQNKTGKKIDAASAESSAVDEKNFDSEVEAADAWRSTWGIRGFQFFGTLFGKQTLWRELRRMEKQPEEPAAKALWRAARGGKAHQFIATLVAQDPLLATINEIKTVTKTTPPEQQLIVGADGCPQLVTVAKTEEKTEKGRIVGIEINGLQYITHTTKWELETDYKALREMMPGRVTVNHNYPRNPDFVDWTDADPPPKPPPNATWH